MPLARSKRAATPAPSKPTARKTARAREAGPDSVLEAARELAWAGKHPAAIAALTQALDSGQVAGMAQLQMLDLRAESHLALAAIEAAMADAISMRTIATKATSTQARHSQMALAYSRLALVQLRQGDFVEGVRTATAALKATRAARSKPLEALCLFRLSEGQFRAERYKQAIANGMAAAALYAELGDAVGQGRALWSCGAALANSGEGADALGVLQQALTLARDSGDLYGAGNALNLMNATTPDALGPRLAYLNQALVAFQNAGYMERQGVVMANLAAIYERLGLYGRSRRMLLAVRDIALRARAKSLISNNLNGLVESELRLGNTAAAHAYYDQFVQVATASGRLSIQSQITYLGAKLALLQGDAVAAMRGLKRNIQQVQAMGKAAFESDTLAAYVEACLTAGKLREALAASARSMQALSQPGGVDAMISVIPAWWQRYRALTLNGMHTEARAALESAYAAMNHGIRELGDEGLRRNYLNKVAEHRAIVQAWVKDARKRRLAPARRREHLAGEVDPQQPFQRLVDSGLRLNELRTVDELHAFLIDEATEMCGAERVLLVREGDGGPRLAGAQVPQAKTPRTCWLPSLPTSQRHAARAPRRCRSRPTRATRWISVRASSRR